MMKTVFASFLFFVSALVFASDRAGDVDAVRLSFDRVQVTQLVQVVYGDVLKQNYVLHPDLVNSDKQVTLHFQVQMNNAQVRSFMLSFLKNLDIVVEDRGGYLFIAPAKEKDKAGPDDEVFYYKPKYRAVSYITDLSASLFKEGRFTGQRSVRSSATAPKSVSAGSPTGVSADSSSQVQQQKPIDNGTNAFSQQDKGDADAFIFTGPAKEVAMLQRLLEQIDTAVGEVLVKGVVYEVTTTSNEGSALSLVGSILGGRFGVSLGSPVSGDYVSITTPNFSAALAALAADSRFRSLNDASVRVKSGSTGVLSVGSDVPLLGAVTLGAGGTSQQSITYQQSGVIFNLSPVVRDGSVELTIDQEVSNFVPTTSGVTGSPTLIKRRIATTVGASNDDVIVLGGLDVDSVNSGSSGPNFFSGLLRSVTGSTTRTEIVLVLNVHKI